MNKPATAGNDKRTLIAEALLEGAQIPEIRERLIAAGCQPSVADYELRRAAGDPFFRAADTLRRRLEKRDWLLKIHGRLAATGTAELSVDRAHAIGAGEFLERYYRTNRPVILTGMVEHWPARQLWSLDYLDSRVGDAVVELQGERESAVDYELAKDRHRRCLPLRLVTEAIRADVPSNDFYVTAYNNAANRKSLEPIWGDIGPLPFLDSTRPDQRIFWLGPKDTLTPFHHDLTNNLLVQLMGRKRVLMVPPWETGRMQNRIYCFSDRVPAQWEQRSEQDFPTLLQCIIEPGDAIFLPVGWWHHVEALDASISVSFTNFIADNDFHIGYPIDARF